MSDRSRRVELDVGTACERQRRNSALLQVWFSPSFPIGAYAYSHGLEKAAERHWIGDRSSLQSWIADLISHGSLWNDLVLVAAAWRATIAGDTATLRAVAELALAHQPTAERYLEATQQGQSFLNQIETAWPADAATFCVATDGGLATLPVAIGYASACHRIDLGDTLRASGVAFVSNLTSAAIRLSIIGQTDAQRVIAALLDQVMLVAGKAEASTLDDLGAVSWRSDVASMQHETQHTRLFRS